MSEETISNIDKKRLKGKKTPAVLPIHFMVTVIGCCFTDSFYGDRNWMLLFRIFVIAGWMMILSYSDAYYINYLIVGIFGLLCYGKINHDFRILFARSERANLIAASLFSLVIIAANYNVYSKILRSILGSISSKATTQRTAAASVLVRHFDAIAAMVGAVCFPIMFLGGMYVVFCILKFITDHLLSFQWKQCTCKMTSRKVFLTVFLVSTFFHSAVMLLCFYPGIISLDSIDQLTQIVKGSYSNRHPFFHTMFMQPFIWVGIHVFNDINIGVAFYSLFSIALTSAAFSYAVATLHRLRVDKKIVIVTALSYVLMPYHLLFSFTLCKDVPYSASVLVFTVSVFRYVMKVGTNRRLSAVAAILSGSGICFFRGNGLIVFALVSAAFALSFRKRYRKLTIAFVSVLTVSVFLTYPVLGFFDITQSDKVELLCVPLQQISRVIAEDADLSEEETELVNHVVSIEKIKDYYNPGSADPIKNLIRHQGNRGYIDQHKGELFAFYIKLGLRHPYIYLTAWIDLTKGYWNSGGVSGIHAGIMR